MRKRMFALLGMSVLLLNGCQFARNFDVSLDDNYGVEVDENGNFIGEVVKIQLSSFDVTSALQILFGDSTIEPYRETGDSGDYEVGDQTFYYGYHTSTHACSFIYCDYIDGAVDCYSSMVPSGLYFLEYLSQGMRTVFPEENLDACTKEEAIDFCQPYAEVFGYGEADVSVYAMTLDCLNRVNDIFYNNIISAPGEGFERITYEIQDEWMSAVSAGEKTYDEYTAMMKEGHIAYLRGLEWEKKYEAMLLYYRPYLNGKIIDSVYQAMEIIYVPYYNRVVYVNGLIPYEMEEVVRKEVLVSQEEAISTVLANIGAGSQEDITIDNISLVYSVRAARTEIAADNTEDAMTVDPCWRIDYTQNLSEDMFGNNKDTLVIDAVDGMVNRYLYIN